MARRVVRVSETSSSYSSWTSHFTNLINNCISAARRVIEKVHARAAYQAWVIGRGCITPVIYNSCIPNIFPNINNVIVKTLGM